MSFFSETNRSVSRRKEKRRSYNSMEKYIRMMEVYWREGNVQNVRGVFKSGTPTPGYKGFNSLFLKRMCFGGCTNSVIAFPVPLYKARNENAVTLQMAYNFLIPIFHPLGRKIPERKGFITIYKRNNFCARPSFSIGLNGTAFPLSSFQRANSLTLKFATESRRLVWRCLERWCDFREPVSKDLPLLHRLCANFSLSSLRFHFANVHMSWK